MVTSIQFTDSGAHPREYRQTLLPARGLAAPTAEVQGEIRYAQKAFLG
ncbi:hypothetical protein [Desulfonatronospira sp.]|nr:hypothetical protein [Desulfonatronospira sp.]